MTATTEPVLYTGPSKNQTFETQCWRRWWFRYVHNLGEMQAMRATLGTVLHGVIERYLKADRNGRDLTTGEPVNLYPEGWQETLLPMDADQVKRLFQIGVAKGVITHPPTEFRIEQAYSRQIRPGVIERGKIDLVLPAEIQDHKSHSRRRWALSNEKLHRDLQMRSYAAVLRKARLADGQPDGPIGVRHNVFVYRDEEDAFTRQALLTPDDLERHEHQLHRIADDMISIREIPVEKWREIPGPHEGSNACETYPPHGCPYRGICAGGETPERYRIRLERSKMTPEQAARSAQEETRSVTQKSIMGLLGKKVTVVAPPQAAQPAPAQAAVSAPPASTAPRPATPPPAVAFDKPVAVNPTPPPAAQAAPTTPVQATGEDGWAKAPPWAKQGCTACKRNPYPGFASSGQVCPICLATAPRDGRPGANGFVIGIENGVPTWTPRVVAPEIAAEQAQAEKDVIESIAQGLGIPVELVAQENTLSAARAAEQEVREEIQDEQTMLFGASDAHGNHSEHVVQIQVGQVVAEAEKPKRGRPRKVVLPPGSVATPPPAEAQASQSAPEPPVQVCTTGTHVRVEPDPVAAGTGFVLCVGCRPFFRTGQQFELLELTGVIAEMQTELARSRNVSSYYLLNAFERRDMLCAVLGREEFLERLEGRWVFVPATLRSPDSDAVLAALRPLARMIVEA